MLKYFLILNALIFSINTYSQGLKTNGKGIVDASDKEVLLRGMGLGGWALMEGYMMHRLFSCTLIPRTARVALPC